MEIVGSGHVLDAGDVIEFVHCHTKVNDPARAAGAFKVDIQDVANRTKPAILDIPIAKELERWRVIAIMRSRP